MNKIGKLIGWAIALVIIGSLGTIVIPLAIIAAICSVAYGAGKLSRWT